MTIDKLLDIENQRILIVDDTPQNLDVLGKTLRPYGYNLAIAQSGEQAIKTAQHFDPDLILLDVMMPGIDGYETCRRLKKIESLKDVPVIFVTAKHDVRDIIHGFEVGGVDYINKPFMQEEICARIKSHLQLYKAKKKLIKLNHQKNRFLAIAAHDLRNPLTSIMGFSELMLHELNANKCDIENFHKRASLIFGASNTMYQLINDLLDISIIEEGGFRLDKLDSSICELLADRVSVARILGESKSISIECECLVDQTVIIDKNRITQVLDNLLGNAIKFSPKGSLIIVKAENSDETLKVCVIDNGPGIPDEEKLSIFDDYKTLSNRPTAGEKSTGLGMSIVKKIIDAHNGTVSVLTSEGGGTTIIFELPVKGA